MLEENGRVVRTEDGVAWIETSRQSSCGSCEAKGCGTGALSKVLGNRSQQIRAENTINAVTGEQVVLGIRESALIKGSLAVFLVPLLMLMLGGLLGETVASQMLWQAELTSVVFAVIGFLLGLVWLRGFNRRVSDNPDFNAVILRRVKDRDTQPLYFHPNE